MKILRKIAFLKNIYTYHIYRNLLFNIFHLIFYRFFIFDFLAKTFPTYQRIYEICTISRKYFNFKCRLLTVFKQKLAAKDYI
jgi:hypothetical protein